jgi:hypothetical protein
VVKFEDGTPSDLKVQEPLDRLTVTFEVHPTRLMAVNSLWAVVTVTWPLEPVDRLAVVLAPLDPPARMVPTSTQATPKGSAVLVLMWRLRSITGLLVWHGT